mgnify:CR=1 FL=1
MKQPVKLKEITFAGPRVLKWRESDRVTTHRDRLKEGQQMVLLPGTFTWYEWVAVNQERVYEELG